MSTYFSDSNVLLFYRLRLVCPYFKFFLSAFFLSTSFVSTSLTYKLYKIYKMDVKIQGKKIIIDCTKKKKLNVYYKTKKNQ